MLARLRALLAAILTTASAPALADARADSMLYYKRANAALVADRPRVARIELLNAIKADPGNGAAHLMQGLAYVRLGDGVAAEAEVARARETGLAVSATRHLMAEALLAQGETQRALDEASEGDIAPTYRGWAARLRGRARVQLGDRAGAAEDFADAVLLAPRDPLTWAAVGRFRATAGDALGSLAAADRALALAPRNPEALILKGELARTQYGLVAALPWFDRALAIDPDNVSALLEKAATLGDLGQTRAMLAATRGVIARDADNPVAFYLQAALAARARNFPLARALMLHTRGAMDGVPAAMLLSAAIDYQTGRLEQAVDGLDRLVALQPENAKARRLLAAAQWRAGDLAAVVATLRPLADQAAADSYTLTLIGRALERGGARAAAASYLDRAALPLPQSDASGPADVRAIGDLRRILAADPGDHDSRGALARALIRNGQLPDAFAEALRVLRSERSGPSALVLVGDVQAAQHRYREAAELYRRAANISFTEPVALRLIDVLRGAGRGDTAYHVLALYLEQNPRSVAGQSLASDLAMASGQWDRAVDILESLRARLGDRDAALLNNLAWAYHESGRAAAALPLAAAAYALVPANPATADTYGWLLLTTGRDPRGIALVEQAAAQAPANAGVHWHLAQAYAAAGRRAEARAETEAALALPGFTAANRARALLAKL